MATCVGLLDVPVYCVVIIFFGFLLKHITLMGLFHFLKLSVFPKHFSLEDCSCYFGCSVYVVECCFVSTPSTEAGSVAELLFKCVCARACVYVCVKPLFCIISYHYADSFRYAEWSCKQKKSCLHLTFGKELCSFCRDLILILILSNSKRGISSNRCIKEPFFIFCIDI